LGPFPHQRPRAKGLGSSVRLAFAPSFPPQPAQQPRCFPRKPNSSTSTASQSFVAHTQVLFSPSSRIHLALLLAPYRDISKSPASIRLEVQQTPHLSQRRRVSRQPSNHNGIQQAIRPRRTTKVSLPSYKHNSALLTRTLYRFAEPDNVSPNHEPPAWPRRGITHEAATRLRPQAVRHPSTAPKIRQARALARHAPAASAVRQARAAGPARIVQPEPAPHGLAPAHGVRTTPARQQPPAYIYEAAAFTGRAWLHVRRDPPPAVPRRGQRWYV
jgi:hypothetical protein